MIEILGLNHGKLDGMRPGYIMCLWSDKGGLSRLKNQ
jgi:hypothetical protein